MPTIAKSTQTLSTSKDYTHALRSAKEIEYAIDLVTKDNKISNFPDYIKKYNELREKVLATHDTVQKDPNLLKIHDKLVEKLEDIERRVGMASAKMGVLATG